MIILHVETRCAMQHSTTLTLIILDEMPLAGNRRLYFFHIDDLSR